MRADRLLSVCLPISHNHNYAKRYSINCRCSAVAHVGRNSRNANCEFDKQYAKCAHYRKRRNWAASMSCRTVSVISVSEMWCARGANYPLAPRVSREAACIVEMSRSNNFGMLCVAKRVKRGRYSQSREMLSLIEMCVAAIIGSICAS
jgi:hypothetical protein